MKYKILSVVLICSSLALSFHAANAGNVVSHKSRQQPIVPSLEVVDLIQGKSIVQFIAYVQAMHLGHFSQNECGVVEKILGQGALVDELSVGGFTSLKLAIDRGDWSLIQVLLQKGADPLLVRQLNQVDDDVHLEYIEAVGKHFSGDPEVRELPVITTLDLTRRITHAREHRSIAELVRHLHSLRFPWLTSHERSIVEKILAQGAPVDQLNACEATSLSSAVQHLDVALVQLLLRYQANAKAPYRVCKREGGEENQSAQKTIVGYANDRLKELVVGVKESKTLAEFYWYLSRMMLMHEIVLELNLQASLN